MDKDKNIKIRTLVRNSRNYSVFKFKKCLQWYNGPFIGHMDTFLKIKSLKMRKSLKILKFQHFSKLIHIFKSLRNTIFMLQYLLTLWVFDSYRHKYSFWYFYVKNCNSVQSTMLILTCNEKRLARQPFVIFFRFLCKK